MQISSNYNNTNGNNKINSSFSSAVDSLIDLKAQFDTDYDPSSAFYQSQIDKKRTKGYGVVVTGGPRFKVTAAAMLEPKLVPELNASNEIVQNYFNNFQRLVEQAYTKIGETNKNLKPEMRKIDDVKIAVQKASPSIPLDDYAKYVRPLIIESAEPVRLLNYDYMRDKSRLLN